MKYFLSIIIIALSIFSCRGIVEAPIGVQYTRVAAFNHLEAVHIPIFIDGTFSQEYKLGIDNAISRWNYALNGHLVLDVKSTTFNASSVSDINYVLAFHGLMILSVDSNCSFIPQAKGGGMTLAWANIESRSLIYVVRDRVGMQAIFGVMLHEVGHILGAHHTSHFGLMNPTYSPEMYACIDAETVGQVANFNHLSIQNLNYCKYIY